jgi:hypothetical protein
MGLTRRVALIDMTGHIASVELAKVAAAIDMQVRRDVAQFWPISAVVFALPGPLAVPPGVWPVYVVSQIDDGGAGFHQTDHFQPYAEVLDGSCWSLAASHEVLEMLIDPSGNDLVAGTAVKMNGVNQVDDDGVFEYLLEICDPCEHPDCAYLIDGVVVSDFVTPQFYESEPIPGARYNFQGTITAPRRVLQGGYLSWWNAAARQFQRLDFMDPNAPPKIQDMGSHPPTATLREFVDGTMRKLGTLPVTPPTHPILQSRQRYAAQAKLAATARAKKFKP